MPREKGKRAPGNDGDQLGREAERFASRPGRDLSEEEIARFGKMEEVLRDRAERRELEDRTTRENRRVVLVLVQKAVLLVMAVALVAVAMVREPDAIFFAVFASGVLSGATAAHLRLRSRSEKDFEGEPSGGGRRWLRP